MARNAGRRLYPTSREARRRKLEAVALRYDGVSYEALGARYGMKPKSAMWLVRAGRMQMNHSFRDLNWCAFLINAARIRPSDIPELCDE